MTYASPALRRKPQEVSEHFIKLVHARIAEVSGWKYIFERIPAFKDACAKPRARFLARLLAQGNRSFVSDKKTFIPDVRSIMTFR